MTFNEFKLASSKFFTDFDERILKSEKENEESRKKLAEWGNIVNEP